MSQLIQESFIADLIHWKESLFPQYSDTFSNSQINHRANFKKRL